MPTKRIELEAGDWIEIHTRSNHAQSRRMRRSFTDPELDNLTEGVAALAANWRLRDVDGNEIPFPGASPEGVPSESLDRIPSDTMATIGTKVLEVIRGAPDPNDSAAKSDGSLPASGSE